MIWKTVPTIKQQQDNQDKQIFVIQSGLEIVDRTMATGISIASYIEEFVRNIINSATARTIATSLFHSKVDHCNSLLFLIFLALNAIVFSWFLTMMLVLFLKLLDSPIFHLLSNWLKIYQRILYQILSITYKTL